MTLLSGPDFVLIESASLLLPIVHTLTISLSRKSSYQQDYQPIISADPPWSTAIDEHFKGVSHSQLEKTVRLRILYVPTAYRAIHPARREPERKFQFSHFEPALGHIFSFLFMTESWIQ